MFRRSCRSHRSVSTNHLRSTCSSAGPKDLATEANEKKKYAKAAELYVSIAEHEPDEPDWRQRAGEALRKLPDAAAAVVQLARAATQTMLAGLSDRKSTR